MKCTLCSREELIDFACIHPYLKEYCGIDVIHNDISLHLLSIRYDLGTVPAILLVQANLIFTIIR
jgi:hypothetical protein